MTELDYVVVLAGGLSPERDISLRSGSQLRDALSEAGVQVVVADADSSLLNRLRVDPPSAVFPVIHGAPGEDGSVPQVLELLSLPYVGSLPAACRIAFDKPAAKAVVAAAGLRTPSSVSLPRETFHDLGAAAVIDLVIGSLGVPLFVKPTTTRRGTRRDRRNSISPPGFPPRRWKRRREWRSPRMFRSGCATSHGPT